MTSMDAPIFYSEKLAAEIEKETNPQRKAELMAAYQQACGLVVSDDQAD